MTNKRKLEEVQYYLDRMSDAALKIIRSVAENPSLLDVEKEIYLKEIANRHDWVRRFIEKKIDTDPVKIYEMVSKKLNETCRKTK